MTGPLFQAHQLSRGFRLPGGRRLLAVDDVSFRLHQGETLALVGESGSGKTTLGRMVVGLTAPQSGSLTFAGSAIRAPRREVQMVFQDSAAALNPRHSIGESVMAPLVWALGLRRPAAEAQARALLDRVGLAADHFFARLPHELSGGQRQRVGIARALAPDPSVLVADEPVSALDVSVRAQILLLFRELRDERGLAALFITHDLGVVRSVAQRGLVLYRGRVVEQGPVAAVMDRPRHPYSQALRAATPVPNPDRQRPPVPRPPDLGDLPGCAFRARCPGAHAACAVPPTLRAVGGDHDVACHLAA